MAQTLQKNPNGTESYRIITIIIIICYSNELKKGAAAQSR